MKTDKDIRTDKSIFLVAFYVVMVSRILVLTNNYTWGIEPVLIEIAYVIFTASLLIIKERFVFRLVPGPYLYVLASMLIHTVLWGVIFTDKQFGELIFAQFKPQIMFVVLIAVTVWALQRLKIEKDFLKCACYALSTVMVIQFVRNIDQVDFGNLVNIFSAKDRTRANFGFGHYNALGMCCVCNLIMLSTISRSPKILKNNVLHLALGIVSIIMLLCSASRSALTSLVLYIAVLTYMRMEQLPIRKRQVFILRMTVVFVCVITMAVGLAFVDFSEFLEEAQRMHLITETLPTFLQSGKLMLGLGYASNEAYAQQLTPYVTRWLDNAYVYYLVTTGFVGLAVILSAAVCMGFVIWRKRKLPDGDRILAVFCVYLYISMFEVVMFNSGMIVNYIYLPWMLGKLVHKGKKCDKAQLQCCSPV